MQDLLRLVGYELAPPVAASADLDVLLDEPAAGDDPVVRIPHGQVVETKPAGGAPALPFTHLGPDLDVDRSQLPAEGGKRRFTGLPVTQCRVVAEERIGTSTGEPDQRFGLAQRPVVPGSVEVVVRDAAGDRRWTFREHLLYHEGDDLEIVTSGPESDDFTVRYDADAVPGAEVVFGDGVFGRIPPTGREIVAAYRVGGGAAGNVAAGTITEAKPKPPGVASVTNPRPAAGGSDAEALEHARRFGPLAFRSGDRAVTMADYVTLARRAGGVGKVRARATGWNRVELYVGAEGEEFAPVPAATKERIVAYFENRRMVGTSVWVRDPTPVPVDVTVEVVPEHHRDPVAVQDECLVAVRALLAYRNVDFGRPVYLSKVYEAVEALPGVAAANVSRFRRRDDALHPAVGLRLAKAGLGRLAEDVRRTFAGDVAAKGRIDIGDFEIPVEGDVTVNVEEGR
jgi:predicted phage baseplate assembly protein